MRRTAILISGFLRTFWFNCQNLMENLIVPNDADVFVYTGGDRRKTPREHKSCSSDATRDGMRLDFDEPEFFRRKLGGHLKGFRVIEDEFDSYVSEFRSIYPMCPYCIRGPKRHPECSAAASTETRAWHAVDSYLRLRRCNEMRKRYEVEMGIQYGAIVRIRGDIRLSFRLDLPDYPLPDLQLHVEGTHDPAQRECFFFGNREIMDRVCSGFVQEYGRTGGTDLEEFKAFLAREGVTRKCYNSREMHFNEDPEYIRSPCTRTGRPCECDLEWADVTLDHENELAERYGIKESRILLL